MSGAAPTNLPGAPRWLIPRPVERPRVRLLCLPWAGGGASGYGGWAARLPRDVELRAFHLPGRAPRFREPPHERLDAMVDDIEAALPPLDAPFALFGHSMGAILAHGLAARLHAAGRPRPAHLFVSAAHAPHRRDALEPLHGLADAELVRRLRALGGIPDAVIAQEELLALVLPAIRADLTALETAAHPDPSPLPIPITAFGGLEDAVTRADLEAWRDLTEGPFAARMFWGDHFYLQPQEAVVVGEVARVLAEVGRRA